MIKTVRFYELRILKSDDDGESSDPVEAGFWSALGQRVNNMSADKREIKVSGKLVSGEHRSAVSPALSFFYIGRVRDRSEWPDAYLRGRGPAGALEPSLTGAELFEPTYVVPFGLRNRVAVLCTSASAPRVGALEHWFTRVAGLDPRTQEIMFDPILNQRVYERLNQASGAKRLLVKVEPGARIPSAGGGQIASAARAAQRVSSELTVDLGWSLETRRGSQDTTSELLRGARWLASSSDWIRNADVALQLPGDDDDVHTETYSLIKSRFTASATINNPANRPTTDESVLRGIQGSIDDFNREFGR